MTWQRANKPQQKLERRQDLIKTAWQLLQQTSYSAITMSSVAQQAGVAKGTIYRYFLSKEALFLSVQEQQLDLWFNTLDQQLAALPHTDTIQPVTAVIWRSIELHSTMLQVLSSTHHIVEQSSRPAEVLQFKRFLHQRVQHTGMLLESHLSWLTPGNGIQLMLQIYVLLIGFRQLADLPPAAAQALGDPRLAALRLSLRDSFLSTLALILAGWRYPAV